MPRAVGHEHAEQGVGAGRVERLVGAHLEPPPGRVGGAGRRGGELGPQPRFVRRAPERHPVEVLDRALAGGAGLGRRDPAGQVPVHRQPAGAGGGEERPVHGRWQGTEHLHEVVPAGPDPVERGRDLTRAGDGDDLRAGGERERRVRAVERVVGTDDAWLDRPGRVVGRLGRREQRVRPEHVPHAGHPGAQVQAVEPGVGQMRVGVPQPGDQELPTAVDDARGRRHRHRRGRSHGGDPVAADEHGRPRPADPRRHVDERDIGDGEPAGRRPRGRDGSGRGPRHGRSGEGDQAGAAAHAKAGHSGTSGGVRQGREARVQSPGRTPQTEQRGARLARKAAPRRNQKMSVIRESFGR